MPLLEAADIRNQEQQDIIARDIRIENTTPLAISHLQYPIMPSTANTTPLAISHLQYPIMPSTANKQGNDMMDKVVAFAKARTEEKMGLLNTQKQLPEAKTTSDKRQREDTAILGVPHSPQPVASSQ